MNWTWLHRLGSPAIFYRLAGRLQGPCLALAGLLLAVGLGWGLFLAPPDYQQGDSFRIIYVHVPAAFLAQSCYLLLAVAGLLGVRGARGPNSSGGPKPWRSTRARASSSPSVESQAQPLALQERGATWPISGS